MMKIRSHTSPKQRCRHGRYILNLYMSIFGILLIGCASATSNLTVPTRVPAATALAQTFQSSPATASTQPNAAPTNTPQPSAASDAPAGTPSAAASARPATDPRVQASCVPLAATATDGNLTGDTRIDVTVELTSTGKLISPLIYGLASTGDEALYRDLGTPLLRWGGNQTTRFNWEINATNAGSDWYFANVGGDEPSATPGTAADDFVRQAQALGAASILTIPTIGWVAKDGNSDTRSTDVPERGGPPLQPGSQAIPGYDPSANQQATSIKSYAAKGAPFADPPDTSDNAVYQDEWVNHLVQTFGRADAGGMQFYALDNEPDLWSETHRDIHPAQMGYEDIMAMFEEYATAIKAVDPSAQILAPELWGVNSLFFSALDAGDDNFDTPNDRENHNNRPFLPWFLEEARARDLAFGQRRLDVVSIHNYPQNGAYPSGNDPETNALRLRSTQQLWNPDYTDESWISRTEGAKLELIPRLRDWVGMFYPGTKIAITEWNYGEDTTINGGLTIVDVLGIYGREGLDMATYWTTPKPGTPGASAFKIYGNYDNCGRHFGDELLKTRSSDEQTLSAYGSRDSYSGDILIMTVNKLPNKAVEARFALPGIDTKTVQVYQITDDTGQIVRRADTQTADSSLTYTVPPYAATLFVIKP